MNREQTQLRAWGQCELYLRAAGGGRCARSAAQEAHHIVKRSLGGGDEPENIAELCVHHHRAVERRQCAPSEWLYLVRQDDGTAAYATEPDGQPCWFLWQNIRNEMRGVAEGLVDDLKVATIMRRESGWRLLDALAAMEAEGDLWLLTHDGIDGLAAELGATVPTLRRYLNLGRKIHQLTGEAQAWLRNHPPTLFNRAKLGELPPADLDAVQRLMEAAPDLDDVVAEGRQRAARVVAESDGKILSDVTLIATAVTFAVEVEHEQGSDPISLAKRKVLSNNEIVPGGVAWQDTQHTVERINAD